MYAYKPDKNLLPVMPGTRLYFVDTDTYEINDEDTAEGVAVMENEICVIVDGDIYSLNGPYFLTFEDAQEWIRKNRKPTLEELLERAVWHTALPSSSCDCYIKKQKRRNAAGILRHGIRLWQADIPVPQRKLPSPARCAQLDRNPGG